MAFEVAEDHRQPVLARQAVDLLVEHRQQVAALDLIDLRAGRSLPQRRFPRRAANGGDLRFEGGAVGDAVEPLAEPFGLTQAARLLDEYEERGLEGVFGVLVVAEDTPADAEDHRSVPPHQRGERGGIARGDKPPQQVRVGRVAGHGRLPEEMDDVAEWCASHAADRSCWEFLALYRYTAGGRAGDSHSGLI